MTGRRDGTSAGADDAGETVVDARGLRCPLPVIRLARVAAGLEPGRRVTVWSTDPAAVHDVPAWARMRGHTVVRSTTLDTGDPVGDEATVGTSAITVEIAG